eukprot:363087-Chlamydomonas_euryale.AAC.8
MHRIGCRHEAKARSVIRNRKFSLKRESSPALYLFFDFACIGDNKVFAERSANTFSHMFAAAATRNPRKLSLTHAQCCP